MLMLSRCTAVGARQAGLAPGGHADCAVSVCSSPATPVVPRGMRVETRNAFGQNQKIFFFRILTHVPGAELEGRSCRATDSSY